MAIKIYIDQGHNPQNPNAGAEGNGLREQDLVFRIGISLAELLLANGNFEVLVSRPSITTQLGTSTASSLAARVNQANAWGADYFWRLHTNAPSITSASGVEAYAFSRPSQAFRLGEIILEELSESTGLRNRGIVYRPGLYVLRRTAMPAVLVEMGFITNPYDAELMAYSPQLFALGIYRGVLQYYGLLGINGA